MNKTLLKPLIIGVVILLIIPVIFQMTHWQWQPTGDHYWLRCFYFLTETAGAPYGLVTCILFAFWFCWCLKLSFFNMVKLIIIMALIVLIGQAIKIIIKDLLEEPRPFVIWFSSISSISQDALYSLAKSQQAELMAQTLNHSPLVPDWLYRYWVAEISYSFPSGHALFSSSWALLSVILLWQKRCYCTVTVLIVWQILVGISRLMLGMHWPVDIILSVIISALLMILANYLLNQLIINYHPIRLKTFKFK